ncbi:PEP-CTERM sorting domain-containing protein [Thiohalobacter sp.]|uniref:PEP-CTERM sorting domain-containing protein n=1 Tax=Thiohalobacter sp. TaxID=2025948 RepID=UPI00262E8FFC|nr:PEP-CTERM sorting domain-containing protein [Thiohalobacter sp.]
MNAVRAVTLSGAMALGFAAVSAQAVPVTFFGEDTSTAGIALGPNSAAARSSFLAGLTGVGNEDFESFSLGATAPLNLTFPGSSGSLSATLNGTGNIDDSGPGRFATSGRLFWEASTGSFDITFANPVSAFGFNGIDIGDFVTQQMTLTLTDVNNVVSQLTVPHSLNIGNNDNATLFFGFIDAGNSYTSIAFTNAGGGDIFAFDDMVVGDAGQITTVPEPGILALLGIGLAGFAGVRRKAA